MVLVPNRNSLQRQFALGMGLISNLGELSDRDLQVGHQRVYDLAGLKKDLANEEFVVVEEAGFFLKALPNSMMIEFDPKLIEQFNLISDSISPDLLANICVVATMKKLVPAYQCFTKAPIIWLDLKPSSAYLDV